MPLFDVYTGALLVYFGGSIRSNPLFGTAVAGTGTTSSGSGGPIKSSELVLTAALLSEVFVSSFVSCALRTKDSLISRMFSCIFASFPLERVCSSS